MSDWALKNTTELTSTTHIAGYAVHDALGVRLGYVSGCVTGPGGQIRMLKVTVAEWKGSSDYLVPLGAVTLVSDTKSMVQLRDLTKQTIGRRCYRYKGELPEPRLLTTLTRHFRAPRVSVVERLARDPQSEPDRSGLSWTRLAEMNLSEASRTS